MVGRPKWLDDDEASKRLRTVVHQERGKSRIELLRLLTVGLRHAYAKHGDAPWGRHEFYAILLEEVDELWDAIKADQPWEVVEEALVQVAVVCFRHFETTNRGT